MKPHAILALIMVAIASIQPVCFASEEGKIMDHSILKTAVSMIAQDTDNDRKGVEWDGAAMKIVDDPLDNSELFDGRGGEYGYTRRRTLVANMVYSVDDTGLLTDRAIISDSDSVFAAQTDTRCLSITRLNCDWSEIESTHSAAVADGMAVDWTYNCPYPFIGEKTMIETGNGAFMAGICAYISKADGIYRYSYAGLGIFADILTEARMMLGRIS